MPANNPYLAAKDPRLQRQFHAKLALTDLPLVVREEDRVDVATTEAAATEATKAATAAAGRPTEDVRGSRRCQSPRPNSMLLA